MRWLLSFRGETESEHIQKRYLGKDGQIVWCELIISMVRDSKGDPQYYLGIIQDISDRLKAEAEIRLQSEIMTHIADAVYLVRMKDGIIVYTNSQFEKLFGYDHNEMLGKHVSIVNAPTDKSPEETAIEIISSLSEYGYWKGEVQNIKKDGRVFWSYASVSLFDHSKFGNVLVSVQTDITDRKNAESEIKELNEDLERGLYRGQSSWLLPTRNLKHLAILYHTILGHLFGQCMVIQISCLKNIKIC